MAETTTETILFLGYRELFGVVVATKGEIKSYRQWWHGVNPGVTVRVARPEDEPAVRAFVDKAAADLATRRGEREGRERR